MTMASHQETALRYGETLYSQGQLDDALGAFRKVILLCSCNETLRASSRRLGISSKDIPLPICHCKDYLSLPINDPDSSFTDKEAIFRLATQPCSCGSGIQSCHNAIHIRALTNIANVYVAQKAYNKAMQYTSLAITLGPHLPEGYLRMVMVIRRGSLKCTPDIVSRCNWLDTQASHIVRAHGDKNHEMLKPIGRRIRRDIVRGVPAEIRQMILQNLSRADLCRAMRVCKAWKAICRDRQLWKDLRLVKTWRYPRSSAPFRPGTLNNMVKLSGNMATSLTVDGLLDFNVGGAKLRALLKALPELKSLSLSGAHGWKPSDSLAPRNTDNSKFIDFWTVIWENAPSSLNTLRLSSFHIEDRDPRRTLANCRFKNSLRELSLVRLRLSPSIRLLKGYAMSEFISLDTLTIEDCIHEGTPHLHLYEGLPGYASLKSVTLSQVVLGTHYERPQLDWACLQRLVIAQVRVPESKLPMSKSLRSLEINENALNSLNRLMWREINERPFLPALEHFRCHYDPYSFSYLHVLGQNIDLVELRDRINVVQSLLGILRPSIESGTLRYLDLTWTVEVRAALDALFAAESDENVSRKEAVRTLSCDGLLMPSITTALGGNCDEFLEWIQTFPNLTTVGAYPHKSENAHILILWLMKKRPDIKTIYTNVLKGADRDMILAEAKTKDITIIHADRVPEPLLEPLS